MNMLTITEGVILCKCACVLVRKYTDCMQTKTYKKHDGFYNILMYCNAGIHKIMSRQSTYFKCTVQVYKLGCSH